MSDYRELLIGCGNNRQKKVRRSDRPTDWKNLTTLDIDPECGADVSHDLEVLPLPFEDNAFDEIHAYEVLEHTGRQGDYKFFFAQFHEFWRILKPGGLVILTVPKWESVWAYGDPGHTRVLPLEAFMFLEQRLYENEVGKTSVTDYRHIWKGNFQIDTYNEFEHSLGVILKAIKD